MTVTDNSTWREAGIGWDDDGHEGRKPWQRGTSLALVATVATCWASLSLVRSLPSMVQLACGLGDRRDGDQGWRP